MRFFNLCLFLILAIFSTSFGQADEPTDQFDGFKNTLAIVPQYAAISGIRIDYERKFKGGNHWLLVSPQVYVDNSPYFEYDQLTGFGMNIYYKYFLHYSNQKNSNGMSRTTVYCAAGPTYQRYKLKGPEQVPFEFTENGVTYIGFKTVDGATVYRKYGGNVNFGLQFAFERFLLDLYAGIGIRYTIDENGNMAEIFNDGWLDIAYSGILLDGGVRLGIFLH